MVQGAGPEPTAAPDNEDVRDGAPFQALVEIGQALHHVDGRLAAIESLLQELLQARLQRAPLAEQVIAVAGAGEHVP